MHSARLVSSSDTELSAEQQRTLADDGYALLPDILSPQECDQWSRVLDELWETQSHYSDYVPEPGVQLTENPLRYALLLQRSLSESRVLAAVRTVLGPKVAVDLVNGRRTDPGYGNQPLHDLKRRRGPPFLRCSTIWCLDDFTRLSGSTRFIPGSHLSAEPFLSRLTDPLEAHPDECQLDARRGSVLVFNSALIHGGAANRGRGPRRSLQNTYIVAGESPQYDWHALPDPIRAGLTPANRELLGLGAGNGGRP